MQCVICAAEKLDVTGTVKRGLKIDIRTRQCGDCGAVYIAVETIDEIILDGQHYKLDKLDRKSVEVLQDAYMEKKTKMLKGQLQMFSEVNYD